MTTIVAGLDIESTGLDFRANHKIIEIAITRYELETQKHIDSLAMRFNPRRSIDPKAQAFRWKIFPQSHYCLNMPVKSLAILAMQAFWLLTMVKRSTSPLFAMNLQSTASLSQSCLLWTLCYPDYGRQKTANGRDWRNSPSHWVLSMTRLRRTARSMILI